MVVYLPALKFLPRITFCYVGTEGAVMAYKNLNSVLPLLSCALEQFTVVTGPWFSHPHVRTWVPALLPLLCGT